MPHDLARTVQVALLGEVPPTLRFVYAGPDNESFSFHAVYADDATDEHLECAEVFLTEIEASLSFKIRGQVTIERNSALPWKIGDGEHLMYLRWGELSA